MKNFKLKRFILFISIAVLAVSCNKKSAADYNNKITKEQSAIITTILVFSKNLAKKDFDAADLNRLTALEQSKKAIKVVEKMEGFDGDTKLKNAALDLFIFYRQVFSHEYKE